MNTPRVAKGAMTGYHSCVLSNRLTVQEPTERGETE